MGRDVRDNKAHSSLLDLPAEGFGNLETAIRRNTLYDVLTVRHHERNLFSLLSFLLALFDSYEARSRELLYLCARGGIQMQRDTEPLPPRRITPLDHRRIVASNFCAACPMRRRSVKFLQDKSIKRLDAVICSARLRVDGECKFGRCGQCEVSTAAKDERANVEEGFGSVGGDEGGVAGHGELYAGEEMGGWDRGDGDVGGGVGEAGGMEFGAEYVDLLVRSTEG